MSGYTYGASRTNLRPVIEPAQSPAERLVALYRERDALDEELADIEAKIAVCEAQIAKAAANRTAAKAKAAAERRARAENELRSGATADRLTAAVTLVTGVESHDLTSHARGRSDLTAARRVAARAARDLGWSLPQIGRWLHRDHTTIRATLQAAATNPDLLETVQQVHALLQQDNSEAGAA